MFGLYQDPVSHRANYDQVFQVPTRADTYRSILRDHSQNRISRVIENCTLEDSSSVYERFFLDCKYDIRIVSRGIKALILDRENVLEAVKTYFNGSNGHLTLDIPVANGGEADALFATEFLRTASDAAGGSDRLTLNLYHVARNEFIPDQPSVTFGDGRCYRKRSFQPNGDYSSHANAEVNFNDTGMVQKLASDIDEGLSKLQKFMS